MSLIIKTSKSWSNAHPSSSWTSWAAWGRATGHTRPWVIDGGPIITRPFVTVTYTKWVPLSFLPFTTTSFPSTPFPSYIVTNTHHSLSRHPFVPQTYTHSAHHIPRNIVNNTTNTNPLSLSLSRSVSLHRSRECIASSSSPFSFPWHSQAMLTSTTSFLSFSSFIFA